MALKSFIFGGVKSLDYGVGITGAGVYSAPERDVEIIEVQGRNGNYILDNGRFNNIELTYPAVMGDAKQADFAQKISAFRNMMLSQVGYQRLEDDYHPDEFRLGACVGGLNVSPEDNSMGGNFDIKFNCKPQRFLKSGEDEVSVASGGTIVNPTAFPSSPLLMVEGYGDINLGDETVSIQDSPMGEILLTEGKVAGSGYVRSSYLTSQYYATDSVRVTGSSAQVWFRVSTGYTLTISEASQSDDRLNFDFEKTSDTATLVRVYIPSSLNYFTAGANASLSLYGHLNIDIEDASENTTTYNCQIIYIIRRNGRAFTLEAVSPTFSPTIPSGVLSYENTRISLGQTYVNSTYSSLGNPLYLDLENGQAYKYDDGVYTSVNNAVWLGAELPTLKSGVTTITYDEDIHDLKIVPRWWKI